MLRSERLRSLFPKLSILLIWMALGALGFVMHSWFIRSAEAELENSRQTLTTLVLQTIGREFQRYGLLVSEFEAMSRGRQLSSRQARSYLEKALRTWGPSGAVPDLIDSVALIDGFDPLNPQWQAIVLDQDSLDWQKATNPNLRLQRNALTRLGIGELVMSAPPGGPNNGEFLLLGRAGQDSSQILAMAISSPEFYASWVLPALGAAIPDAHIEIAAGPQNPAGMDGLTPPPGLLPPFNPLTTLLGLHPDAQLRLQFPLPYFSDFYRSGPGVGSSGRSTPDGSPPVHAGQSPMMPRRFMFSPWIDRTRGDHWGAMIINLKPGSAFDGIEWRLTLNWLGAMAMLAGVGIAFSLVVLQTARLRETRFREREFVAAVTHELRTPLTVIQSCADNIASGIVANERMQAYGELVRDQAHRLGHMIEDVLRFAGVEGHNQTKPELVSVFPAALVADLRKCLEPLVHASQRSISWALSQTPHACRSDPDTLRLVLENLILNANNHAYPPGSPGAIRVNGGINAKNQLWFSIEDDGRGIPLAEAKRVFEPFFRGKTSRLNQESGAGLGLHLARRKARLLGGELTLESPYRRGDGQKRSGCRFILAVPYIPELAHA